MSDSPYFVQAVSALTHYFVGSQTLGNTLHEVSGIMMQAVPVADHVGITLLVDGKLTTSVFTHPEVPEIDSAQYRTGEGPCLDAYRNAIPYRIDSTLEPGRWQAFRDSAARHGVRSTLAMPLMSDDGPIGVMNLYAETVDAFDTDTEHAARLFARQAAFLLANAQAYWDARTLSENLEEAMRSRAAIEQAKGVIMSTMRCTPDQAMEVLVHQSQLQNIKLRDLAAEIVRNSSGAPKPNN